MVSLHFWLLRPFLQRSLPKSLMLSILLTLLLSMLLLFVFLLAFSSSSIKSSRFFSLFVLTGVLTLGTSPRWFCTSPSWFWLVRIANVLVKHETSPLSPDTLRTNLPNQIFFVFFCLLNQEIHYHQVGANYFLLCIDFYHLILAYFDILWPFL